MIFIAGTILFVGFLYVGFLIDNELSSINKELKRLNDNLENKK